VAIPKPETTLKDKANTMPKAEGDGCKIAFLLFFVISRPSVQAGIHPA
jgi:hypothetical protein